MSERVAMLRRCLESLAADPVGQLHSLRQQGFVEPESHVDELALDYDAISAAADDMLGRGELNLPTRECMRGLDTLLTQMSGAVNAHLWTAEALRSSHEWERVRALASACLETIVQSAS